jgi:hypothetical protein
MTTHESSTVAVFDDLAQAEQALDELRRAGFSSEEIGIIGHMGDQQTVPTPAELKAPEANATFAMAKGGIWGAIVGTAVIAAIPGLARVSDLGLWFEIVGGALLGAVVGGVLFAVGSLGFLRPKAQFYRRQLEKGRFVVTVKNPQRNQEAISVLRRQSVHAEQVTR